MDVAQWLRSLGLAQYEQAFRDNAVDADTLPRLTSDDLKELGVHAVGHRRKLLDAIARLDGSPAHPANTGAEAERRQLTVMFCDLVGSTALANALDPEEYRPILSAYHEACARTVTEFGGFVAKYMGDGVLAYFGYPQAHEDDAVRAVRAGLALTEAGGARPGSVRRGSAARPGRDRHGPGGGGRLGRRGCCPGTECGRRDPEPCGAAPEPCAAGRGGDCASDQAPAR